MHPQFEFPSLFLRGLEQSKTFPKAFRKRLPGYPCGNQLSSLCLKASAMPGYATSAVVLARCYFAFYLKLTDGGKYTSLQISPQPFSLKNLLDGIDVQRCPHVAFKVSADHGQFLNSIFHVHLEPL